MSFRSVPSHVDKPKAETLCSFLFFLSQIYHDILIKVKDFNNSKKSSQKKQCDIELGFIAHKVNLKPNY